MPLDLLTMGDAGVEGRCSIAVAECFGSRMLEEGILGLVENALG